MNLSIFLPVRKGSERIKEKNTRKFCNYQGGLLELKLEQLAQVKNVEQIVVSTNDGKCREIVQEFQIRMRNLKLVNRPEHLGTSQTDLLELIRYVPEIISSEEILWTHVTSPFCNSSVYNSVIMELQNLKERGYDSILTGRSFREFLIDKKEGTLVNNPTSLIWPRTQDLADWFEINNAIFLAPRREFLRGNRIGKVPYYMEFDKLISIDIDNEEDFRIAEVLYKGFYQ